MQMYNFKRLFIDKTSKVYIDIIVVLSIQKVQQVRLRNKNWKRKTTFEWFFTVSKSLNFYISYKNKERLREKIEFSSATDSVERKCNSERRRQSSLSSSRQIDRVKIQLALAVNCMILVDSIHLLVHVLAHMLLFVRV